MFFVFLVLDPPLWKWNSFGNLEPELLFEDLTLQYYVIYDFILFTLLIYLLYFTYFSPHRGSRDFI